MIVSCAEMKALENKAFAAGCTPEAFMEVAGAKIASVIQEFHHAPETCYAVFGKGNNGADALVAVRHLKAAGWKIQLVPVFAPKEWGHLTKAKFADAQAAGCAMVENLPASIRGRAVILDGILGIGAQSPLQAAIKNVTRAINNLRRNSSARVYAIDFPTGLAGDTGHPDANCVKADVTLAIGFVKRGLVADGASNHVGRLAVLTLPGLEPVPGLIGRPNVATAENLRTFLPRRDFDTHKGDYGRIAIVAGSPGMIGAAILCATGAMRAGGGLITLYVDKQIHALTSAKTPPEIMLRRTDSCMEVMEGRFDAVAVGPGLGEQYAEEVTELIWKCPHPMVVDADAINALAKNTDALANAAGPRLLTPHPGEMARLDEAFANVDRSKAVELFTRRFSATILLKGSRTIIGQRGQPPSFNTTGNAGMACGGMGDALTGIIAGLLGRKIQPYAAAQIGAWLSGRASELAISDGGETEETLTPSRMLDFLGLAFHELRDACY